MRIRAAKTARGVVTSAVAGTFLALSVVVPGRRRPRKPVTYLFPAPPEPAGIRSHSTCEGQRLLHPSGPRRELRGRPRRRRRRKASRCRTRRSEASVSDGPIMVRAERRADQDRRGLRRQKGFMQLVAREDANIQTPADLKGKTISVMSFQDTTYYALLGLLASAGLRKPYVNIQSAGPSGVWELVATGRAATQWPASRTGSRPSRRQVRRSRSFRSDQYFPHMAQAIGVSDQALKEKPELVGKFVKSRASRHEGHHGRSEQGGRGFRRLRAGMERQGRRRESGAQLLCDARLSGSAAIGRDQMWPV